METSYEYDTLGRPQTVKRKYKDSIYTEKQEVTNKLTYMASEAGTTEYIKSYTTGETNFAYTYTPGGQIASVTKGKVVAMTGGTPVIERAVTQTYEYDNLGRLYKYNDGRQNTFYDYDGSGNMVQRIIGKGLDDAGGIDFRMLYYEDQIFRYGMDGENIDYDECGNPKNYLDVDWMTWTRGKLLAKCEYEDGKAIEYAYNKDGQRVKKSRRQYDGGGNLIETKETRYIYDGGKLVGERWNKRGNTSKLLLYVAENRIM